jgi:hypothetical protein
MADGVLRWEDPPAEHGNAKPKKPSKYQPVADALRANPNRWGVVAENRPTGSASSLSHHIRYGLNPWTPAGAFETKTVGPAGGRATVYARYIGEPGPTTKDGE